MCHASSIAGNTVIGLGNPSLDLQGLFEDLAAVQGMKLSDDRKLILLHVTLGPVLEEILFRGYLFGALRAATTHTPSG